MWTTNTQAPITLSPDLVIIGLRAAHADDAIRDLSERLYAAGCVTAGFAAAAVRREGEFATGLPTAIPVALPHTDPEHCLRSAVAVGVLKQPVEFGEMGNHSNRLPVEIVFVLSVSDPKDQVAWLRRLMLGFRQEGFLHQVRAARTPEEVITLVIRHLAMGDNPADSPDRRTD